MTSEWGTVERRIARHEPLDVSGKGKSTEVTESAAVPEGAPPAPPAPPAGHEGGGGDGAEGQDPPDPDESPEKKRKLETPPGSRSGSVTREASETISETGSAAASSSPLPPGKTVPKPRGKAGGVNALQKILRKGK